MSKVGRPALDKTTKTKSIKLDEKELPNWNSKKVHEFLQGIHEDKNLLKQLYELMGKMEFIEDISPEDMEFIEKIHNEVKS